MKEEEMLRIKAKDLAKQLIRDDLRNIKPFIIEMPEGDFEYLLTNIIYLVLERLNGTTQTQPQIKLDEQVFLLEHGFYDREVAAYFQDAETLKNTMGNLISSVHLDTGHISFFFKTPPLMCNPEDFIDILRKAWFRHKHPEYFKEKLK